MRKHDFITDRIDRWDRLAKLLTKLERTNASRVPEHELDEFVHLYRMACSDLARARSEELGDDVEGYLNVIISRGHKLFHPRKAPRLRKVLDFFRSTFPGAVRAQSRYVLVATLLFALPIAVAAALVVDNPARAYLLTSPQELESLTDAYAQGHQGGRSEDEDSFMTGFYVNNNIGVAFRCFATGIFFGLGSVFFLIVNGLISGAVGAYICVAGYGESFLSFVVGHGAFELTAIVLSGAMGLRIGMILLNPGKLTRMHALRRDGPQMINVILGAAAMLVVAALIEGFWSPSGAPSIAKFIVGGVLWTLVFFYLALAGRSDEPETTKKTV